MNFGLIYPPEKSEKMRTKRYLDSKNIPTQKITALIEIPKGSETLKTDLEEIGNTLIPVAGAAPIPDKTVNKFNILDRLFRKAIREGKKTVIKFLLTNLSEDEIKLLREDA